MSKKMEDVEKLNVHLKGDVTDKFRRIKLFLGLEQDTEVIRALITWYYNQHEKHYTNAYHHEPTAPFASPKHNKKGNNT